MALAAHAPAASDPMSGSGHIAAPDVCDGTSAVGESRHRIPGASVGQPTEPCLVGAGFSDVRCAMWQLTDIQAAAFVLMVMTLAAVAILLG